MQTGEETMSDLSNCPACADEYMYQDGPLMICPTYDHEWSPADEAAADQEATRDVQAFVLNKR